VCGSVFLKPTVKSFEHHEWIWTYGNKKNICLSVGLFSGLFSSCTMVFKGMTVLDMEIRWMVCAQVVNMVIIRNVLSLGNEEYLVSGKSNMCQSVGD
jgi:hypothetical protein